MILKSFPVDIFGVKEIGVEQWRNNFFWPVSDGEFFCLADQIGEVFHQAIQESDRTIREILISNIGLIQQYSMFLHALLVIDKLKKTEHQMIVTEKSQYYSEILANRFPEGNCQEGLKFQDWGRNRIKQTIKCFLRNQFSHASLLKRFKEQQHNVSLGSFGNLKKEYCKKKQILVNHRSHVDFLKFFCSESASIGRVAELEEALKGIVDNLEKLMGIWGLSLHGSLTSGFAGIARHPVYFAYSIYQDIIHNYKRKVDTLLLSEVARPVHKAICFALKRKFNTKILGFEHGNTFGSMLSECFSPNELAHCDEYIVSTPGSVPNFREAQKSAKLPYGTECRISSVDTDYYRKLAKKNMSLPLSKKVQRVMLIGFPMNQSRYLGFPGHFSLFHLDLELRLLGSLKTMGLETIYKVHPDRLKEAKGIFDTVSDEIMSEPFEEVYTRCDAYLFAHTDSSTFGIAVCTNKPIIVIEIEGKPWRGNAYDMVSKRCRIVPAWMDEKSKIAFSEEELKRALQQEIAEPNMEYLENMMGFRLDESR